MSETTVNGTPVNLPKPVSAWVDAVMALPRPLLIALDVDGTLAPIVPDPYAATIPPDVRDALGVINAKDSVTLALITGRDASALQRIIDIPEAYRAVEHGAVLIEPGDTDSSSSPSSSSSGPGLTEEQQSRLDAFAAWAETLPDGVRVERKARSVGVHVRVLASDDPGEAQAILEQAAQIARSHNLTPRDGRSVCEAELEPGDKGAALATIMQRSAAMSCFYAGDDVTDYPAIQFAAKSGIGLFVRSAERPHPPEGASGALPGTDALAELLKKLSERI